MRFFLHAEQPPVEEEEEKVPLTKEQELEIIFKEIFDLFDKVFFYPGIIFKLGYCKILVIVRENSQKHLKFYFNFGFQIIIYLLVFNFFRILLYHICS